MAATFIPLMITSPLREAKWKKEGMKKGGINGRKLWQVKRRDGITPEEEGMVGLLHAWVGWARRCQKQSGQVWIVVSTNCQIATEAALL